MNTNDNKNVHMQTIFGLHSNLAQADRRGVKMSSERGPKHIYALKHKLHCYKNSHLSGFHR